MSTQVIEEQWKQFSERVLPLAAGDIQRSEMKRAFFAGVTVTIMTLNKARDIEEQTEVVNGIFKEINAFSNQQILMDRPAVGRG